jgi:tRNA-binding protein
LSISIDDFAKVKIRVGKVLTVDDIPEARKPMYKLTIDFGSGETRQCVGGIKPFYTKEQLLGRQVVAVVNLQPKSVVGVVSECMMLAASVGDEIVSLLSPDREMPLGSEVR